MELSEKISVKIRGCLEDLGLELNDYLLGIGEIRVYNIANILNKHNIQTIIKPKQEDGLDVLGKYEGKPCVAVESTNYGIDSYLSLKNAQRYINNLSKYPEIPKFVVCSFRSNIVNQLKYLRPYHIKELVLGYQTLPSGIYGYMEKIGEIDDARLNDANTLKLTRQTIENTMIKAIYIK
jgi:hypothetical protein